MPVRGPNSQGKYAIGSGPYIYKSLKSAKKADKVVRAKEHGWKPTGKLKGKL